MGESVFIASEPCVLLPERAFFWPAKNALVIADLHLGKATHFRRSGIPIPAKANDRNIEAMVEVIQKTNPHRVILLGDLFHSHYNEEWEVFGQLIRHFAGIAFELVIGNHDIMSEYQYTKHGIVMYPELIEPPFFFTHHPVEAYTGKLYNIAGHIHPGAQLIGKGRQRITLPCFYFGEQQGILPAFGAFTGVARVMPKKNDQVYVIVEDKIIKM